ncbi:hypothetical protein [Haliangium sp.]|uniref:hypothetical protein n=1 Tax=Haliangium sp. TaxID=2663208 RepID=UPI003D0DF2B0
MGLYKQPNDWTCGPFALKHALVTIGRLTDEQTIARIANPHWWAGTNEVKLARAARHFDCDLPMVRRTDPDRAKQALVRYMSQKLPVILCVDQWDHWITVVRYEHERFVLLDSRYEPVVQVTEWRRLRERWQYEDEDEDDGKTFFDMHPVKPRFKVEARAQFSVERAQFLRRPENELLALHWDAYLGDLLQICRPPGRKSNTMSMAEFLRRHQGLLVARVMYWHGHLARPQVERVLKNFRFVAETYGLIVPAASTRQALVDLAILLALWAAASGGVDAMYGSDQASRPKPRRRRQTR